MERQQARWLAGQAARVIVAVIIVGAITVLANLVLFLVLEPAIVTPQLQAATADISDSVDDRLQAAYDAERTMVCRRSFNTTRHCTIEEMVGMLEDRSIDTYEELDAYLRDASLLALLRRHRALRTAPDQTGVTGPPAEALTAALLRSQDEIMVSGVDRLTDNVTATCQQAGHTPEDCLGQLRPVLEDHTDQWTIPIPAGDGCVPTIYRAVNGTVPQDRTGVPAIDSLEHLGVGAGIVPENTSASCVPRSVLGSRTIRSLMGLARMTAGMAPISATTTTNAVHQTDSLTAAAWRSVQ